MGSAERDHYDLLIVGAGPAGCASAISAAQMGLRSAIVERASFPRFLPGEALHPGIRPLLRQLGVESELEACNFQTFEGIWRHRGGKKTFSRFGPPNDSSWLGLQAVRSTFDSMLLGRAVELGVDVYQPVNAIAPIVRDDGSVGGLETSIGKIHSQYLVDASGGRHWLSRRLNHSIVKCSPTLIARYGYESQCPFSDESLPIICMDQGRWEWHAKIESKKYQWVKLSWNRDSEYPKPTGPFKAVDVTWRRASNLAGSGFFLAGEAATVVDPASSHGVLRGIMSGIMSAHAINEIQKAPDRRRGFEESYDQWLGCWFEHDVTKIHDLYFEQGSNSIE